MFQPGVSVKMSVLSPPALEASIDLAIRSLGLGDIQNIEAAHPSSDVRKVDFTPPYLYCLYF